MTDWLLAHSPWSFIGLSYGIFAVALLGDGLHSILRERALLRRLRAEHKRLSTRASDRNKESS